MRTTSTGVGQSLEAETQYPVPKAMKVQTLCEGLRSPNHRLTHPNLRILCVIQANLVSFLTRGQIAWNQRCRKEKNGQTNKVIAVDKTVHLGILVRAESCCYKSPSMTLGLHHIWGMIAEETVLMAIPSIMTDLEIHAMKEDPGGLPGALLPIGRMVLTHTLGSMVGESLRRLEILRMMRPQLQAVIMGGRPLACRADRCEMDGKPSGSSLLIFKMRLLTILGNNRRGRGGLPTQLKPRMMLLNERR